jgi:NAD-dependent dihydropyrimidine dehydrogenase PreA subunit
MSSKCLYGGSHVYGWKELPRSYWTNQQLEIQFRNIKPDFQDCYRTLSAGFLKLCDAITACRPAAKQRPRNRQLDNGPQTSTEEQCFLCRSCQVVISRTVSVLELVGWKLVESCCSWMRGYFGNPEEEERTTLEVATRQRLVKTDWEGLVPAVMNCKVCELVKGL